MKTIDLKPLLEAAKKSYRADYSTPYDMPMYTKVKGKWEPFLDGVPCAERWGLAYKYHGKTYRQTGFPWGTLRAETTPLVRQVLGLE